MSFVQSQSLTKLTCATCKKYLSHFPIYYDPQKGSICGRCQKPSENTIRNEIYESLAHTLKFPCFYSCNGCTENLLPSQIPEHEQFCSFIKHTCPMSSFTNCMWQGFVKDLLEHFEQKHPTFLLNSQFELDFINSHKENYLLPFGTELFVVKRVNDSRTNTFSCTVFYIGNNAEAANYLYKLILENGNKSHVHTITNKLNVTTDINGDVIRNILNDPTAIIARIEIMEMPDDDQNIDDDEEEAYSSAVNFDLLRELECVVCMEYMVPPISQCITGHSICVKCKSSVSECPTCKEEFRNTQNFVLAQVINHITYPCKHPKCRFTAKPTNIKQHEATCVFGPHQCPLKDYEGCHTEMMFSQIYDHVVNNHYESLLEIDTVCIPFEFNDDESYEECYILKYGFKLFKLHFLYNEGSFFWAMQLLGPGEESVKYKFEIDIVDNSGNNDRVYFKKNCSPLCDSDEAFKDDKSFISIDEEQIKSLITNDFTYRVRISQN